MSIASSDLQECARYVKNLALEGAKKCIKEGIDGYSDKNIEEIENMDCKDEYTAKMLAFNYIEFCFKPKDLPACGLNVFR